ncbi:MAG: hypothetical protein COV48_01855 [Elusimicrobia bacterium CG11_big_fil_rev_8_21_14_0_20_64_6]|nr:MAG: hypothetical protein COV48_01855 [Elusimicrobia bacterium CG11_big_fil_rev_8_21_14_0_20_64_6]
MPSNEELQSQLSELSREVHSLRGEVDRLKGVAPSVAAVPEPEAPALKSPEPKPAPAAPAETFEDLVRKTRGLGPLSKLSARSGPPAPARDYSSAFNEKFIGEKMLQYVGALILGLGVIFFLIWRAQHTSPHERALMAAGVGAVLVGLGLFTRTRPPYQNLSGALVGGGWSVLYITAYAVYHFAPVKVVDSPEVALLLLLAAAGGMISHALLTGSRAFRLYAFGLTYFLLLFCRADIASFDLFLLLLGASAAIAVESGEADVLIPSLIGFHANYIPVYFHTVGLAPGQHTAANFAQPFGWLMGGYLIIALMPFVPRARTRLWTDSQKCILDGALCLNAALFALVAGSLGRVYFGHSSLPRAGVLASLFLLPAIGHLKLLGRKAAAVSLGGVLPLALVAVAVFEMPDPMWKLTAWVGLSTGWVFIGLFLNQPVWRAAGLCMALLTFIFYTEVARRGEEARRAAAMALFVFSGLSYFFSRFHRLWLADPEEWEKPVTEYWLYIGTASLVLGLWGALDAAPFLCCLVALAIVGEHLAVALGRLHLWVQAAVLELGFGFYFFFVDYGAGGGAMSPRLLVTAVVIGAYLYLLFADPMDEALSSRWEPFSRAEQRRAISWMLLAVAAFAVYREFDGRLRLPIWAFTSLGLFWLGRTQKSVDFRAQAMLMAAGTGLEAGTSYLMAPAVLLSALTVPHAALFWSSIAALLGGLGLAKSAEAGTEGDDQAATMFAVLALVLGAAYFAKELDRVQMTLAWTGLAISFLAGGITLGWRELRLPGLGLLGLCVAKALLFDTANLPLPNRVASFVALGVVLIFASVLYNRAGASE